MKRRNFERPKKKVEAKSWEPQDCQYCYKERVESNCYVCEFYSEPADDVSPD